ncbi:hypothetical protein COD78_18060 [Bacillus cereus]|uniref:hypothetical protein n=1 Tax=Bacillus cereus group TaxID=86661 RepID=UPI000BF6A91E|nr:MULTISPECIES: hypothetical protein [Bacillus cereus group]PEX07121.1 hypothetical protein CN454_26030 [Bacillus cereus]PFN63904.1 hypothetical protein COJ75_00005 [Bacillus thuringiensis]PGV20798.1 hypothetical protein COD78_18060 [Bacillus cereus]
MFDFELELFDFYSKKLSKWNLVYKYVLKNIIFLVATFISIAVLVIIILNIFIENDIEFDSFYLYMIFFFVHMFLFLVCMHYVVVKPAILISVNKYNISFKSKQWQVFICLIVQSYLFKKELLNNDPKFNEESLQFLIKVLKEKKEETEKLNVLKLLSSYGSLFFLFTIPVWSAFNSWVYNHEIKTSAEAIQYLLMLGFLIFMSVFLIWMPFKKNFLEELFSKESSKISDLIKALENINFSLRNSCHIKSAKSVVIKQSTIDSIIKGNTN